jgi:hypothetical protein
MKKYLLAYQIIKQVEDQTIKQTVGVDLENWDEKDLNNNVSFQLIYSGQTIPENYINISSIKNWHLYGANVSNDYLVYKNAIKDIVEKNGWLNLSNEEKDLAIQYYSYTNPTEAVIYLMTVKGYNQQQAQYFLLEQWHKHHANLIVACKQRWYYAKLVVPMFLSFTDSEDLLNTVEPLIFAYVDMGRLGINYGDKKDGIMDYIESTNMFFEQGLKENNYTLLMGTWDIFIENMKNVFIEGIYNKYDNV